jgi:hypothetical protein
MPNVACAHCRRLVAVRDPEWQTFRCPVIGRFKTSHRWALQNQQGEEGLSIVSGAVPGTFTRS